MFWYFWYDFLEIPFLWTTFHRLLLKSIFWTDQKQIHLPKSRKLWVLLHPIITSSPHDYFCVRIIQTSRIFSTPKLSTTPGTSKSKINLLLPFLINYRSFARAFHTQFATSFSPHPFICLSNRTWYCFTFYITDPLNPLSKREGGWGRASMWRKKGIFR